MKHAALANAVGFQLCWIGFVACAARDEAWPGFVLLAVFVAFVFATSRHRRADALLVVASIAIGTALDSALAWSGLVAYRAAIPSALAAPVWIVGLWIAFALTLNHSLAWLKARPWAAAAFGVIGGPVSYAIAAHAWGALSLAPREGTALLVLAASWGVVVPTLTLMAAWLDALATPAAARAA